jgi:hypothetical protein
MREADKHAAVRLLEKRCLKRAFFRRLNSSSDIGKPHRLAELKGPTSPVAEWGGTAYLRSPQVELRAHWFSDGCFKDLAEAHIEQL